MAPSPELAELLRWARQFGTGTTGGLTNHLPMGAIALERIGADAARLAQFADDYRAKLVPIAERSVDIAPGDLVAHLGTGERYPDLLALFDAEVAAHGCQGALRSWLGLLIAGVGADAFHPLIRLAYGVDLEDPGEVAAGLAYLADARRPLEVVVTDDDAGTDLAAVLAAVAADPAIAAAQIEGFSIASRMAQVGALPSFSAHAAHWRPEPHALGAMAEVARRLYAPHPEDFTAMHTVTGLHALRLLLPWLDDPTDALRVHGQAIVAAFVANGLTPMANEDELAALRAEPWPTWDAIAAQAMATRGDEHAYKVAYTCRCEAAQHDDEVLYRSLAARLAALS